MQQATWGLRKHLRSLQPLDFYETLEMWRERKEALKAELCFHEDVGCILPLEGEPESKEHIFFSIFQDPIRKSEGNEVKFYINWSRRHNRGNKQEER